LIFEDIPRLVFDINIEEDAEDKCGDLDDMANADTILRTAGFIRKIGNMYMFERRCRRSVNRICHRQGNGS
jgi:hypothetical protein